jgi:hypothetical protein
MANEVFVARRTMFQPNCEVPQGLSRVNVSHAEQVHHAAFQGCMA